jgi:hypothetical protein
MSEPARYALEAFAAFFVLCGGGLYMIVTQARLLDGLRARHPEVWNAMGRPSIFPESGGFDSWMRSRNASRGMLRMVMLGSYRDLNDPALNRICLQLRVAFVCFALLFAGLAVAMMFSPTSASHR